MLRWDIGAGERLHHPQINFNCPEYLISHCFMCDRSLFERNDAKGDKFGQNMGIKLKNIGMYPIQKRYFWQLRSVQNKV